VKTIGIVGGLAWPSTVIYYRTINELVARRLGGLHCARLVLAQTDFDQVERYQRAGRWDLAGDLSGVMPQDRLAFSSAHQGLRRSQGAEIRELAAVPTFRALDWPAIILRQRKG
jgi:hypothetical protein